MTRLVSRPRLVPGWVAGLVQDAEPGTLPVGTIVQGENFVPQPAGLQQIRGGSRIVQTLHDDAGSPAELSHVCLIEPFTPVGAVAIGWSDGRDKHYAYRLTSDLQFFTGSEATSRHDLTAGGSWNNGSSPARPIAAELFEKLFVADATADQTARDTFFSLTSTGTVTEPSFSFAGGAASKLKPYCLEEYNGVLFLAGYGDEGDKDRPEILRHSFLAKSPDAADGFDKDAYELIGAKGKRVTALRKGRGLLLAAKASEFYRITGFGRAYPGWQYTLENVQNTLGLGISNPLGLTFAEGYWYGIGLQGPLRTDGYAVESLAGPRQRGWRAINQVDSAWVAYHPERRLVLFGVHPSEASAGRSATYPWVLWAWDIERQVWQTDAKYGTDVFMAAAVTQGGGATSSGPSAAPSAPNTTSPTVSGYTANWTNGDVTAYTEVWEKEGAGGTWTLVTTVNPGVATYPVTGRKSHIEYFWRVRHRKNGVTSEYCADTSAKTLMTVPNIGAACTGFASMSTITATSRSEGTTTLIIEESADGAAWSPVASGSVGLGGTVTWLLHTSTKPYVRTKAHDGSWPTTDTAYTQMGPLSCP